MEQCTFTEAEATDHITSYLTSLRDEFSGTAQPFAPGSVIQGDLLICDFRHRLAGANLSLRGIMVTGCLAFDGEPEFVEFLEIRECRLGGLKAWPRASFLDLRGTTVSGVVDLHMGELGHINCDEWQVPALRATAPTVPLIVAGMMREGLRS